ncbi:hypothetical protein GCM10010246_29920 [Streptomyces cuspidosporus]|uniref:Uncharacterized protein n=1 Tax=Streptomyces cuspidosporus TaxID=66882 RepID=A0ABP5T003_9ACTN
MGEDVISYFDREVAPLVPPRRAQEGSRPITAPGGGDEHSGSTHSELSGSSRDVVQARNVHGGIHFHTQGGPDRGGSSSPTPRQLPADVRGFVNRTDELGELNAVLTSEDGGPLVVCVYVIAGTAGAGRKCHAASRRDAGESA